MSSKELLSLFEKMDNFGQTNGYQLKLETNDDISYQMTVSDMHLSSPTTAHGGTLAGFMDAILGTAALAKAVKDQKVCSTVEFKMNFFSPAKKGDRLLGEGTVEHCGQSLLVSSATISNQDSGEIIAKGLGTFNLYPISKRFSADELDQLLGNCP